VIFITSLIKHGHFLWPLRLKTDLVKRKPGSACGKRDTKILNDSSGELCGESYCWGHAKDNRKSRKWEWKLVCACSIATHAKNACRWSSCISMQVHSMWPSAEMISDAVQFFSWYIDKTFFFLLAEKKILLRIKKNLCQEESLASRESFLLLQFKKKKFPGITNPVCVKFVKFPITIARKHE